MNPIASLDARALRDAAAQPAPGFGAPARAPDDNRLLRAAASLTRDLNAASPRIY